MAVISLRVAGKADLAKINEVINLAIEQWDLPERVKRLSLPSYLYTETDFNVLRFIIAEVGNQVVGVASWEPITGGELPKQVPAILLHGLYVSPSWQGKGIGAKLFAAVEQAAKKEGYQGILVRAQAGAGGFFRAQQLQKLNNDAGSRHYGNRYWKEIAG